MQKNKRNIFLLFFSTAWLIIALAVQAAPESLLQRADSLYEKGKYTEARLLYRQLMEQYRGYSAQMLAKSAFIAEGTENYDEALYYLMLLYTRQADKQLYNKITDLATRYELTGYTISDEEFIVYLLRRYLPYWGAVLMLLAVLMVAYTFRRMKRNKTFWAAAVVWFVTVVSIIYILHNFLMWNKAIIRSEKAFIMSAPAAGAELIITAKRGSCFRVTDVQDIWCRITWDDKTGYVRRHNLWLIN